MSETPELPGVGPTSIPITDEAHMLCVGEFFGLASAVETLNKTAEKNQTPGYAYAKSLVELALAKAKTDLLHRNLRLAAKHGVNLSESGNVSLRGFSVEIVEGVGS